MEGVEDEAKKKKKMRSKKRARLKSFLHFSKALKKLHGHGRPSANDNVNPSPSPSAAAAAGSLLSACMHPRTNSFSSGARQRHVAAGNRDDDDDDGALAVNFRSLRVGPTVVPDDDDDGSSTQEDYGGSESEGGGVVAGMAAKAVVSGGGGGVAVVTLSVAPYEDFRRSMREMADAHARMEAARAGTRAAPAVDWDFMEELLFCYLQLNDRAVHKDILRAFTDTVAALRRRRRAPAAKPKSRRTRQPRRGARGYGVEDDADADEAMDSNS
ncbi:hypothetical protein D1007_06127 [Hordeum vulgare]|uniref:Transcription repressor n=1 Tax=Hordeum vulgare subsp. vulgare TaxID=112509 RepID=A0A8I6XRV8_HORVV|nr:transcription repressor OFP14-like [Hordeum vulgare subsp. vulgare]KAE8816278.1 hypothetical protein D1007_06127 [Hordeum vulgare]KAI4963358.1 hypothetical protein ZWY2020_014986 [Hordeum vulgare]